MRLSSNLKRYLRDESAATAIEYGLVAAIIGVAVIGITATGGAVSELYNALLAVVTGLGGGGGDDGGGGGG